MATVVTLQESAYDRAKEIQEFDDSKIGVKGLLDAGATVIPRFFIHPLENLSNQNQTGHSNSPPKVIPVIDLTGVNSNRRPEIIEQIRHASYTWGFFQIINHGIPTTVLEDSISAVKSFHEQPTAWKAGFYTRDNSHGFRYSTSFDFIHSKAACWRDSFQVRLGWNAVEPDLIPAICRKEILAWDEHATSLAETVMGLLTEGLGVGPDLLKEMTCLEERLMLGHYNPYCPQAELTMGIASHSDPVILTVLLQDQIGGLQVKHDEEWVELKPMPGALVVNVGDFLQIITNDEYMSVKHRVVANGFKEPRISIALLFYPRKKGEDDYYGPLPELLSPEKPPHYRNFTFPEYIRRFLSNVNDGKSFIQSIRL